MLLDVVALFGSELFICLYELEAVRCFYFACKDIIGADLEYFRESQKDIKAHSSSSVFDTAIMILRDIELLVNELLSKSEREPLILYALTDSG